MRVSFWGVRGSVPVPRRNAWRYGGNTPCVEVRAADHLFILDAGTGIQELGQQLSAESARRKLNAHLLFTHYHWDHLQGLPFFEPLYQAGNAFDVYGPRPLDSNVGLPGVLPALFRRPFFPVSTEELKSSRRIHELDWESDFTLNGTGIRTCQLNHPQGALAYRLHGGGVSVVYATDHEPGNPANDRALRELASGADLLICDAQYLPSELSQKAGWGHGSWETSVAIARDAGVKNLVLFHHDPFRSDRDIDQLLSRARESFSNTWAATEGSLFEMTPTELHLSPRVPRSSPPARVHLSIQFETPPNGNGDPAKARVANLSVTGACQLDEEEFALEVPESKGQKARTTTSAPILRRPGRSLPPAPHQEPTRRANSSGKNGGNRRPQAQSMAPRTPPAPRDRNSEPTSGTTKDAVRRYERISLEGKRAHAVIRDKIGPRVVSLLDLSMGGMSFLLDETVQPPDIFYARLHVPILKFSPPDLKIQRVYSQRLTGGRYRIGCRFAPEVAERTHVPLNRASAPENSDTRA